MMEKLQPSLRFPEFKDPLTVFKFGDLYTFLSTNSFSRDKMNYDEGDIYNIHYGDIHTKFNSRFILESENVPRINLEVDISKIKEELYCKEGDIIIADASEDYNDIGKSIEIISTNNEKLLSGLHTFLARPTTDKTHIGFINIVLKSWYLRKQIMLIAQGTKVLSLSSSRFSDLKLFLPSLPEQQKIATFLTAVDEKLALLKEKKNKLEQYKKGVMQKIFSQELRFKIQNEVGELVEPAEWEEKRLGEVVDVKKGDQLNKEELNDFDLYPCINGGIFPSGFTHVYNRDEKTITISEGGNSCGYINFLKTKFWCGGHCYTIEIPKKLSLNIDYFYQVLKFNELEIMKLRVGSGLPNIQKKDLLSFKLIFSHNSNEQTKIANFLTAIDEKIEIVNQQIKNMEEYKKGLLQGMFC